MKLSIITATYNSAATVADTFRSVAYQTYPDIEHIVVDGKSTDDTLPIASSFPHIKSIVSEKDNGIYDAMNKGIALCSGDVIGILNSDDFYPAPDILQKVMQQFVVTGCDAVYGNLLYVDAQNVQEVKRSWKSGEYSRNSFLYGWMPPHPTFFVKKTAYEKYGGFNLQLGSAADYELMLRFLYKHGLQVAYLPETIVHMRVGGVSNKTVKNRILANQNDRKAWEVNHLQPYFFTLYLKPLRKITQFIFK
ncbi:MAG: glycosyltransferase [Bacteroidota bacterium]|nr:glycosyltransferase [Bacteroidota bacterium]